MRDMDDIDLAKDLLGDEAAILSGRIARWLPTVVVVSALAGFIGLAWYAYRSGAQSLKEEDLLVIEADKTPMKEKPLDPGGMKFPNQDKTVFETFAAGGQAPARVERVLPPPEEPMPQETDGSETKTWVNDKLPKDNAAAKTEQLFGSGAAAPSVTAPVEKPVPSDEELKRNIVSYAKPVEKKPEAADVAKAQLGAYRSEKEAKASWEKIQQKYPELIDKTPSIVRADLGAKGIYYRLRLGFASADDAKTMCMALSSRGQPCLVAKE